MTEDYGFVPPTNVTSIQGQEYGNQGSSFPFATWLFKADRSNPETGFFAIDQEKIEQPHGWVPYDVEYPERDGPGYKVVPSWVTRRLRGTFLAERRGWLFYMNDGTKKRIPWNDKWPEKELFSQGKPESQVHVLVQLDEPEFTGINPISLTMNRRSRSTAWSHNPLTDSSPYKDWPWGISENLKKYAADMTKWAREHPDYKYTGDDFGWLGLWLSDLVGEGSKNKPVLRNAGQSYFNIPVLDMAIGADDLPATRFMPPAFQEAALEFYNNVGSAWVNESGFGSEVVEAAYEPNESHGYDNVIEEDEMPF